LSKLAAELINSCEVSVCTTTPGSPNCDSRRSGGDKRDTIDAMPETAPVPTPDRKPAWRAACLAYRGQRRAGASHHVAWLAAVASSYHAAWLWSGVGG
jgi:hypothetical protein